MMFNKPAAVVFTLMGAMVGCILGATIASFGMQYGVYVKPQEQALHEWCESKNANLYTYSGSSVRCDNGREYSRALLDTKGEKW